MPPKKGLALLGLASWPYNVVPAQNGSLPWAGRAELRGVMHRLLRRLSSHRSSSLHLLWADFGAGKTHTLLYVKQLALSDARCDILPVYTVLPKAPRSFVDIYRAIILGIGFECLLTAYTTARQGGVEPFGGSAMVGVAPGVTTAFEALRIGSDKLRETSIRWLSADAALTRGDLHAASLPGKIRTTDDALGILSAVTRLLLHGGSRVLLMIDEFQRSGTLRRAYLDEMNAGLHTYFNDCPEGLSMLLSFSFGSARNIRYHLNEELRSRADPTVFTIPALDTEAACEFLKDLTLASKLPDEDVKVDAAAFSTIAEYVGERGRITPRRLIHAASTVFSEACLDLEDGLINGVEAEYTQGLLDKLQPSSSWEDE